MTTTPPTGPQDQSNPYGTPYGTAGQPMQPTEQFAQPGMPGQPAPYGAPAPQESKKKPFYKRAWFIILAVLVVIGIIAAATGGSDDDKDSSGAASSNDNTVSAPDAAEQVDAPAADNEDAGSDDSAGSEDSVPADFQSALRSAQSYSDMMHMSKAALFDQLTSEYADKFSPEAAQYAVDNIEADWNANALEKAKSYQDTMDMSPEGIRNQLTSEIEGFTQEEADYAIAHLDD